MLEMLGFINLSIESPKSSFSKNASCLAIHVSACSVSLEIKSPHKPCIIDIIFPYFNLQAQPI